MNSIGWQYQNGYGVEKDYKTAVEWYLKGVEAGDEECNEDYQRCIDAMG